MPYEKAANKIFQTAAAPILILLILYAAGCGDPKDAVWLNPEKTLEEAEKDVEKCYFEAFLAQRQNPVPEEFSTVEKDPKEEIEAAARKCMKMAGYKRIAGGKVKPPLRIKSGVAHSMDYSIAGK